MTGFDDEADMLVAVIDELVTLRQRDGNLEIELPPMIALQLAGLIQVALRTPTLTPPSHAVAVGTLEHIRRYFAACPAVLGLLADGDDPAARGHFSTNTRH